VLGISAATGAGLRELTTAMARALHGLRATAAAQEQADGSLAAEASAGKGSAGGAR
jgi:hypothetical protein